MMLVNDYGGASQGQSEILHPSSRAVFRFWEAARAEESAPSRGKLDLSQIHDLVPDLLIIELNPARHGFHWRLAGTRVCNLYRRELTGSAVLAGWDSFETDIVGRFLAGVVHNLQPCLLRFRMRTDLGQLIGVEMIGLPLQSRDGKNVHIFGGMFAFRETASLGYQSIAAMELSGARGIWTEHLPGDVLVRQLENTPNRPFQPFQPFQVIRGGRGR